MNVLVVGAGLAGARCAETLRAEGFDGRITILGEEPVAPYERPALSKELLAGAREAESLALRPADSWAEREIELLTGTRVIRVLGRTAKTADGCVFPWDALVVATGANARGLALGRLRLRTLADAERLCAALEREGRLTVVGSGLVGTEVAATAASLGFDVTLVGDPPLRHLLGAEVSDLLAARHHACGVRLAPRGTEPRGVVLDAVGARPATRWLKNVVPLRADGSVVADTCGRTPVPGIYACGDATGTGHWTAAAGQAAAAARAILGVERPYDDVPYFWSDQLGLRLQYVGDGRSAVSVELDGDLLESLRARYLDRNGRIVAALLVNRPSEVGALRRELASAPWDRAAA